MSNAPAAGNAHDDGQSVDIAAVGLEMRQLRQARAMKLADVAKASGISISHLSAIERGSVNPSLEKIGRIAAALAVPIAWFFTRRPGAGPLEQTHVVRAENRRNLNLVYGETPEQTGGLDWLVSSSISGAFYMGISDHPPYSDSQPTKLHVRDGEQHVLVLEGEMTLRLEDEVIALRAGDSYSIPGEIPHSTRNTSDAAARTIWGNAPVTIPKDSVVREISMPKATHARVVRTTDET